LGVQFKNGPSLGEDTDLERNRVKKYLRGKKGLFDR